MKAQSEKKHGSDKEERGKLPESPKTAEEIWQQSVIGDYLARFKVSRGLGKGLEVGSAEFPCAFCLALTPGFGLGAVGRLGVPGGAVPQQQHPNAPGILGAPEAWCWLCPTERPGQGAEGHGGHLEQHGEEGEADVDQEGGGGSEAIRGGSLPCPALAVSLSQHCPSP